MEIGDSLFLNKINRHKWTTLRNRTEVLKCSQLLQKGSFSFFFFFLWKIVDELNERALESQSFVHLPIRVHFPRGNFLLRRVFIPDRCRYCCSRLRVVTCRRFFPFSQNTHLIESGICFFVSLLY